MMDGEGQGRRLAALDLGRALSKAIYKRELADLQLRLAQVQQTYLRTGQSAVVVFEGWDAAGKGGTIRRMSGRPRPSRLQGWPIGAPRECSLQVIRYSPTLTLGEDATTIMSETVTRLLT